MKRQRHQTSYRKKMCIYDSSVIQKAQSATRKVGFFALVCILITQLIVLTLRSLANVCTQFTKDVLDLYSECFGRL